MVITAKGEREEMARARARAKERAKATANERVRTAENEAAKERVRRVQVPIVCSVTSLH